VAGPIPRPSSTRLPVVFYSDCLPLVLKFSGMSRLLPPYNYVDRAVLKLRWFAYLLTNRLPFQESLPKEGLIVHRKRACNTLSDTVANLVLDEGVASYFWINHELSFLPKDSRVVVFSDGAFRSDGTSSCAAVICLEGDTPEPYSVIIAVQGLRLSVPDSMCAEAEGLLHAVHLLVQMCKRTNLWSV
jgi:hypothetical protein